MSLAVQYKPITASYDVERAVPALISKEMEPRCRVFSCSLGKGMVRSTLEGDYAADSCSKKFKIVGS